MPLIIAAASTWLVALGLIGSGWFWAIGGLLVGAAFAVRFKLRASELASSALLSAFFAAVAWASSGFAGRPSNDLRLDYFGWLHDLVNAQAVGVSTDARALVLGLAIGDDSSLSDGLASAMKTVSLTHLTAVSGANCAIVTAAIFFLLRRLEIRLRAILSLVALGAYVLLVGGQPSVLRAATMSAAVIFALSFGRRVKPIVALALSVAALISLDPWLVLSLSFVLSVAATLGLLWLAPLIYQRLRKRLPKAIAAVLSVSLAAQLFCMPILLQLQGGLPTYSLLANLLAEPLVAPITIIGLLAISFSWISPVAAVCYWVASLFAQLIASIASWLAALPFATLPWSLDAVGTAATSILVVAAIIWFSAKQQWLRNTAAICAIALSIGTIGALFNRVTAFVSWPDPEWQVTSCDVGQGDATVVRSAGQIALIDTGKYDDKINSCLNRLGVDHIQLLVLTHYDLDHIGSVSAAVRNRRVDLALVTSYRDERPGANFVITQLKMNQIPYVSAETGMTGRLGDATWQVLNPGHDGGDAEDSNDGSIAMLFHLTGYNLLALADLGERGQMRIAQNLGQWHTAADEAAPLIMKVAHHGSADQYPELIEALHPSVALISVGKHNGYGHPTARTLDLLGRAGALIARTDLLGSISVGQNANRIAFAGGG